MGIPHFVFRFSSAFGFTSVWSRRNTINFVVVGSISLCSFLMKVIYPKAAAAAAAEIKIKASKSDKTNYANYFNYK